MTPSARDAVLAIDVGSSAVRAAVVDLAGSRLAERRVERAGAASGLSFDPEALRRDVVTAIAGLSATARSRVAALAVAGHLGTVFLDEARNPLGPASGWADASGVELLIAALGQGRDGALELSGRPVPSGGGLAAALAFADRDPSTFRRVRHVVHPKDYLIAQFTGVVATDFTSAAYTGSFDVRERSWSHDLLDSLAVDPTLFAPAVAATSVVGELGSTAAAELGLPSNTPVLAGGPDGTVGAAFVLGTRTDLVADVAGTTDVLVRVGLEPLHPPAAVLNPYVLGGLWTSGGPTGMTGGAVTAWTRLLGFESASSALSVLGPELAAIGPGSDGLSIRPSLSGSRFPRWAPAERGLMRGQSEQHGAAHVVRAVVEGAAYVVRQGIDLLAPGADTAVALAGGVARSPELAQLRADVLGRTVLLCSEPDVSLLGAAMIAAGGAGLVTSIDDPGVFGRRFSVVEPRPDVAERYDGLYERWLRTVASESA